MDDAIGASVFHEVEKILQERAKELNAPVEDFVLMVGGSVAELFDADYTPLVTGIMFVGTWGEKAINVYYTTMFSGWEIAILTWEEFKSLTRHDNV